MPAPEVEHGEQYLPDLLIENVTAIMPDKSAPGTSVLVRKGRIDKISPRILNHAGAIRIDGSGLILVPGFIDLHSDAIEKEIRPRPGGNFPLSVALTELDKRLAACGVTTMYHCLCFGESETNELRTAKKASEIARVLKDMASHLTVRNRIHIRFEVSDIDSVSTLRTVLGEKLADLFSIMDHTPGQGQFTELEHFMSYYGQAEHLTGDQAQKLAEVRMATRDQIGDDHIRELTALCREKGIAMASHDDDTVQKVNWIKSMGIAISEFPVRMEAAREAVRLGMQVLMGAPNILRGGSLTGNLSGREAIASGACSLIGSDYSPMSLLHSVFSLADEGLCPLHESIKMVTTNPARAVGMDDFGIIEEGAVADLVMIDSRGRVPRIVKTIVEGREVFSAPNSLRSALFGSENKNMENFGDESCSRECASAH